MCSEILVESFVVTFNNIKMGIDNLKFIQIFKRDTKSWMMRLVSIILISLLIVSCTSVKRSNSRLVEKRTVNELQSDIDFLHCKLERYHPQLYISKSELDYKFDSLKSTINEPMTSREFYYKVAPVVASIKQGHSRLFQSTKDFTSKEIKQYKINSYGKTPLAKMNFGVFNDKLFVLGNDSWNKAISPGTEVVSINGITTKQLLDKFKPHLLAMVLIPPLKIECFQSGFMHFCSPISILPTASLAA